MTHLLIVEYYCILCNYESFQNNDNVSIGVKDFVQVNRVHYSNG